MRRHRRKTVPEINLTPLLDILFSILFIVMMTGMQNEKGMEQEYREQTGLIRQKMEELERQLDDAKEQLQEKEKQLSSYELYHQEAVILTVFNNKSNGNHYLVIRQAGQEETELERILLGAERMENVKTRIRDLVTGFFTETDTRPVYIVFYCDKNDIYTTEFREIEETFQDLQKTHKEVFYKMIDQ